MRVAFQYNNSSDFIVTANIESINLTNPSSPGNATGATITMISGKTYTLNQDEWRYFHKALLTAVSLVPYNPDKLTAHRLGNGLVDPEFLENFYANEKK